MGLNIREIVPRKRIELDDLSGKVLCVDAFNVLYQFLSTIRQADGSSLVDENGEITSHLSGIFYRNISLLSRGVKLVYVFDGEPPKLKYKIHRERGKARAIAQEKYEEAELREDLEGMHRYASQLVRLDDKMISESKELLKALGIGVIQAPGEGEAQAAYLSKKEGVYAAVSQDYDSLIFGCPRLIRNLTMSKKRRTFSGYVEVHPEEIVLEELLDRLGIDQDQLISLAILVGTDYNPKGVFRIGQKKALQLVKQFKKPEEIFAAVEEKIAQMDEKDRFDWKEIFSLFRAPNVRDFEIKFPEINVSKIKEILVERHGFSMERVENQIEKLDKVLKSRNQKQLSKWF